jgi:hypothetical protein
VRAIHQRAEPRFQELHKSLADLSLAQQARLIITLGEMFLRLGDSESARDAVKDGLKIAEKLYARNSDIANPNQIIKEKWPSTKRGGGCAFSGANFPWLRITGPCRDS